MIKRCVRCVHLFIHSLFWIYLVFPLMPSGSSIIRNTECSPTAVLQCHSLFPEILSCCSVPSFQADVPAAWFVFTILFYAFAYSYRLPFYSCIVYFWEIHDEKFVQHVAYIYSVFSSALSNTSSCKEDKVSAQWTDHHTASSLWILQQWSKSWCANT